MYERQIGPTNFSNLAVGIGWLRVAENWAVLKKQKQKRGRAVGMTTKQAYKKKFINAAHISKGLTSPWFEVPCLYF